MPALERLENRRLGGTNVLLAFSSADGGYSVNTRVLKIAHRWEVVATESHAREYRAMYPHQRAVAQFALTFLCKGYTEFDRLMQFFRTYASLIGHQFDSVTQQPKPTMIVFSSVRNFNRSGVPIKGMSMGDHVGSMLFKPTIIFEAAADPQDPTIITGGALASTYNVGGGEQDVQNFFYPFSIGSISTAITPETVYDFSGAPAVASPDGAKGGANVPGGILLPGKVGANVPGGLG